MAKKAKKVVKGATTSVFSYFADTLVPLVAHRVNEGVEVVLGTAERRAMIMQKRMFRQLAAYLLFGLAALFIVLATFYFLLDYLEVPKAIIFLSLGAILLIIAFIAKYKTHEVHTYG